MSKQLISIRVFRSLSLLLLAGICSVSCAQDESSVVAPQPPAAQKQATPQHTQGAGESELSDRLRQAEAQPVPRGRLPRYFAAVVDQIQRLRIYEIQSKYRVQIDEIERRL